MVSPPCRSSGASVVAPCQWTVHPPLRCRSESASGPVTRRRHGRVSTQLVSPPPVSPPPPPPVSPPPPPAVSAIEEPPRGVAPPSGRASPSPPVSSSADTGRVAQRGLVRLNGNSGADAEGDSASSLQPKRSNGFVVRDWICKETMELRSLRLKG